jgi:hypothetical protein
VAPSSFTHFGSFARTSISATDSYASTQQRIKIERLGKVFGCHTCGSKMRFKPLQQVKFHGDHMPPKSVALEMNDVWWRQLVGRTVRFRFYPQCVSCSTVQGSLLGTAVQNSKRRILSPSLAHAGGGLNAYNHGLVPRLYHLSGGVIAIASVFPDRWKVEIDQRLLDGVNRVEQWVRL